MTLDEVLSKYSNLIGERVASEMRVDLLAHEDEMADGLRSIGLQFGLHAQIVAEAICTVELGTPPNEEERAFIRANFLTLMRNLRQSGEGN